MIMTESLNFWNWWSKQKCWDWNLLMLYMVVLNHVQNYGAYQDFGFYYWNSGTNCYCENAVFDLNNCSLVDLCVVWVCWLCSGTGFWRCNQVFDCDDDAISSCWIRWMFGLECWMANKFMVICHQWILVSFGINEGLLRIVICWFLIESFDFDKYDYVPLWLPSFWCTDLIFGIIQAVSEEFDNRDCFDYLHQPVGRILAALEFLNGYCFLLLKISCCNFMAFLYGNSPLLSLSSLAFYGLSLYGDVWRCISWSHCISPCIQSMMIALDQAYYYCYDLCIGVYLGYDICIWLLDALVICYCFVSEWVVVEYDGIKSGANQTAKSSAGAPSSSTALVLSEMHKCETDDISFNQIEGLCKLCFLEQIDQVIRENHLFKESIILIKAWSCYENQTFGAHAEIISTYGLET
ncbi:hypothetical protein CTI12_AA453670 [Artemisia annua]|uniref:PAP/OAS1 substrate-binding-related domain-containing protein n=1 Tax=Artemisia annua TaxID=35608 RepID=A0A2U1LTN5_ARTAN|nr:hypothetical protein CTI12_AA453670 [Artemisia annua]